MLLGPGTCRKWRPGWYIVVDPPVTQWLKGTLTIVSFANYLVYDASARLYDSAILRRKHHQGVDRDGAIRPYHQRIDVEFQQAMPVRFGEGGDRHDALHQRLHVRGRLAAIAAQELCDPQTTQRRFHFLR